MSFLPDFTPAGRYGSTEHLVDRCLRGRDCGARLAVGPWRVIGTSKFIVPVVSEMRHHVMPDYVVEREGAGFKWVKPRDEERREDSDPLASQTNARKGRK